MTVTLVDAPLFLPPSKDARSKGVHASAIIRRIAIDSGILKDDTPDEEPDFLSDSREILDPVAILRICIGLAWEEFYIPRILGPALDVDDHPGEIEADSVFMTPDGESVSLFTTTTELR